MVTYLNEENKLLRARLPKHIHTTPKERASLLRFGRHLGTAIYGVVTMVSPTTFLRWLREERKAKPKKRGRHPIERAIRELILRLSCSHRRFTKSAVRSAWAGCSGTNTAKPRDTGANRCPYFRAYAEWRYSGQAQVARPTPTKIDLNVARMERRDGQ